MTGSEQTAPVRKLNLGDGATWKRGAFMLFFAIAIGIAQALINIGALIQFLSLLIAGERNAFLVDFGAALGRWLEQAAAFQSCASEEKPFPFSSWPAAPQR